MTNVPPSHLLDIPQCLLALQNATWDAITARKDKLGGRSIPRPLDIPAQAVLDESRFSDDFPVLAHLDTVLEDARQGPLAHLVDLFEEALPYLRWSQNPSYTSANTDQSLLDGYAYAAFSGPQGPLHIEAPRGGFMIMGPDVTYPDHNHKSTEVYMLLTDGAWWSLDKGDWFEVKAGEFIYHDTFQGHAMKTYDKPFLAYGSWLEPGDRMSIQFG